MKRPFIPLVLTLAAVSALSAGAAQLKILEPLDRSIVRGTINFQVKPELAQTDQFLAPPDVLVQDEYGNEVRKLRAVRDPRTGICSVPLDTTQVPDGRYSAVVAYRTLLQGRAPQEVRQEIDFGVRNRPNRPGRFEVELGDKPYGPNDQCDVVVRVRSQRGQLMPAARVAFKVDKGEVDSAAELTDSDGEAVTTVDSEEAGQVTLTITVENLAPVTKTIRFVE